MEQYDKDYASCAGTYNFEISEPAINSILAKIKPNFKYETISVLKKDSLEMDDKDRDLIFDVCNDLKNEKIIITHGTDTMTETAKRLNSIKGKTIILVGSSKPEKFKGYDASFNVGCAIGALNCKEEGIYIAMNGIIYDWYNCQKQKETGQFTCK